MYIGKSVLVQHRVATGHARIGKLVAPGVREHLPVPTELQTHHAIVIGESFVPDGEPRLTVVYKKDDGPLNPVEMQSGFAALYDVPHKSHDDAAGELFWEVLEPAKPAAPKAVAEEVKLKAFLLENFKSETGDETPADCAIRLLSKTKKKS